MKTDLVYVVCQNRSVKAIFMEEADAEWAASSQFNGVVQVSPITVNALCRALESYCEKEAER